MKRNTDVLARKQRRLAKFGSDYNKAVLAVHKTLDNLQSLETKMDEEIQSSEVYIRSLQETKENMAIERERAHRVIGNFKKLLEEE